MLTRGVYLQKYLGMSQVAQKRYNELHTKVQHSQEGTVGFC